MDNTYRAIREADRNDIMLAFRELLVSDRGMGEGQVQELATVGRKASPEDKNTISIFVDGKRESWQFQKDVFEGLKGIQDTNYILPGALTILPKIMRTTIVNFPAFAVRNFIRDFQQRVVVTETDSNMRDSFKKRGREDVSDLKLFGGDQAGHYMRDRVDYARAMDAALRDLVKDQRTILLNPKKLGRAYLDVMQQSEQRGRLAEYKSAFKFAKEQKGFDDYNAKLFAAGKSRGLIDFAVAGSWTRVINQLVPFTTAAVRGVLRTGEAIQRNPRDFAFRWFLYIVIPTLLERTYNEMFDAEEYEQLPAYLKDMFYNFKIAPNFWLRIPKPFEIGVMASGVARAFSGAMGREHAFEGYGNSVARSILPVDESVLALGYPGMVQAMANYDFFRDRSIVPPHEEKLDLDLRNTQNASRLARAFQSVSGIDSRKIDFLLREQFGYVGGFAAAVSDINRPGRRGLGVEQTGLVVGAPAYAARDVQWVLNTAAKRGLTFRPEIRTLNSMLNSYWEAPDNEEKDQAAARLRKWATTTRKRWEANPAFLENAKKKAQLRQRQEAQERRR